MKTLEWLSGLLVSEINFVTTYKAGIDSYPMTNASRNHHAFIYTVKGTETYRFADGTVTAVPNSIIYLPKNYFKIKKPLPRRKRIYHLFAYLTIRAQVTPGVRRTLLPSGERLGSDIRRELLAVGSHRPPTL